jgi:hypothetical protein
MPATKTGRLFSAHDIVIRVPVDWSDEQLAALHGRVDEFLDEQLHLLVIRLKGLDPDVTVDVA